MELEPIANRPNKVNVTFTHELEAIIVARSLLSARRLGFITGLTIDFQAIKGSLDARITGNPVELSHRQLQKIYKHTTAQFDGRDLSDVAILAAVASDQIDGYFQSRGTPLET